MQSIDAISSVCDAIVHVSFMALHAACASGNIKKVKALLKEDPDDANKLDDEGITPLVRACEGGHIDVVRFLMMSNADVDTSCADGRTPSSTVSATAAKGNSNAKAILKILKDKGKVADVSTPPPNDHTMVKLIVIVTSLGISCFFLSKIWVAFAGLQWRPDET